MSLPGAFSSGQVHKLFVSEAQMEMLTLVKLLWPHYEDEACPSLSGSWVVEDLRSGNKQIVGEDYLSLDTFNEMEVLAWAASRT